MPIVMKSTRSGHDFGERRRAAAERHVGRLEAPASEALGSPMSRAADTRGRKRHVPIFGLATNSFSVLMPLTARLTMTFGTVPKHATAAKSLAGS